jgi:GT2 family glycosyltransferase
MIGAQLIFGDLPEPFLEAALRSVEWVDYVVAVNTAPWADGARENLRIIRETVPEGKLRTDAGNAEQLGGPDFATARNLALDLVPDGDFVMILDADEVHYPEWEGISQYYILNGADSVTAAFYHMVVYRDAVQAVFPREILFRKYADTQFVGRVHEQLHTTRRSAATADYRYLHLGYLRPQPNVFERWRRYSVIEGEPHHYDGQSPEHVIDDYPICPVPLQGESEPDPPKVGLVLLTKDDAGILPDCLSTLRATFGHFDVAAIDIGSTDASQTLLAQEATHPRTNGQFVLAQRCPPAESLASALNVGFSHFLDADADFIGWIHPDMRFDDPAWLEGLLHELRCWPRVGKVCAANTRDNLPADMVDGQEQCYLIRREVLAEIGLFDEGYVGIGGYEDWDMNLRCVNAGYRVVVTPRAKVFHEGMATRSRRDTTAEQVANAEYYERKWGRSGPVV